MIKRTDKLMVFLSAGILLLAHGLPAYAVCQCESMSTGACRMLAGQGAQAEPKSCCAEEETATGSANTGPLGRSSLDQSIASTCCENEVVSAGLANAILPSKTADNDSKLALSQAGPSPDAVALWTRPEIRFGSLRGPPPPDPGSSLFLQNASLLI